MADKLLKSIKFPTLPDRYVIGDSTLTEEGAAADAKAVGDALATKADTSGTYEDLIVGGAEQLMADGYESDTEPYQYRPTGGSADVGNREYLDSIVGGTVAWNQLVSASATSVTVQSGHKYIAKIGGVWSVAASSGSAISVTGGSDMLIDLTALFNPTIADYIYSLEQATAGAGVAWFRKLFPKDYYPYDKGTIRSVEGVSAHETVGFNQWDEEWEVGSLSTADGSPEVGTRTIRSKNYCKCLPNTAYYIKCGDYNTTYYLAIFWYDENKNFVRREYASGTVDLSPANARYFKIVTNSNGYVYGTTYKNDICINLSDPSRNGEYEPYTKHTYPLDSSLTLRGVPKLVDGKLSFDGDVYPPSGEVQRRYGIKLLDGTDGWFSEVSLQTTGAGEKYVGYINKSGKNIPTNDFDSIATRFVYKGSTTGLGVCGQMDYNGGGSYLRFVLPDGITTLAELNAWLASNPVTLVYELVTTTAETAEGYEHYQICDPSGTEEFVTTGIVPVGHETRYPHDLKKKIETAPDSPSTDGTYLMKRSGGKNTYMALPSTPSANGAYVLTVTVSGGTASYSWTAKE